MKHGCYRNRELSWLDFNERVLDEAADTENPLCERMMFASIFKSNLDEFFMVRVGMLHDNMVFNGNPRENKTGMSASEQLAAIADAVRRLMKKSDSVFDEIMHDALRYGVRLVNFNNLTKKQSAAMEMYFENEIKPLLSPQIVGKKHPFPFLKNKEIYVLVTLETKKSTSRKIGIIPCCTGLFSRLIPALGENGTFMLAEELILHYADKVFDGYKIHSKAVMRVIRSADIDTDDAFESNSDYRNEMEKIIRKRGRLCPVKLELSREIGAASVTHLCSLLKLSEDMVFLSESPLDLSFISEIRGFLKSDAKLFYIPREPQKSPFVNENESIIGQIEKKDIMLSYPYESMKPFLKMLSEASCDPSVVSIKMTLYRVSKFSKVVEALIDAAENGKEVVVILELRARFDEENNIEWSKRLEEAGCRVIYGLDNLKVHSKLCLITRKTKNSIEYITQAGTGNYNEKTARQYTDCSLMTASFEIGTEAAYVLNELAMGQTAEKTEHLLVAPRLLRTGLINLIDLQTKRAADGKEAYIGIKINSLTDKKIIDRLIRASRAGVKIEMIVRGICCLVPGVKGYTENITVRSIVGRFLEHSRIYIFGAEDERQIYISSADLMTRNTMRRVEVAVPIYDADIKARIADMFSAMLHDNVKARQLLCSGRYEKYPVTDMPFNSQEYFYEQSYLSAKSQSQI